MSRTNFFLLLICLFLGACTKEGGLTEEASIGKDRIVVVLGSSTAFGTGATPLDSSWVNLLRLNFAADRKNVTVHNLALGGYTTYHIMPSNASHTHGKPGPDLNRNIDAALSLKPDLVIINLPSNDIAYGFGYAEIIENYKTISSVMIEREVHFLLTSTQPRNFPELAIRSRLATLNQLVRSAFSKNIIDFYNLLTDDQFKIRTELDFGDGIHLNNRGHRIIFDEFLKDKRMRLALGY